MWPPSAFASSEATARPRPVPWTSCETNGRKISSRLSTGTPGPLSLDVDDAVRSARPRPRPLRRGASSGARCRSGCPRSAGDGRRRRARSAAARLGVELDAPRARGGAAGMGGVRAERVEVDVLAFSEKRRASSLARSSRSPISRCSRSASTSTTRATPAARLGSSSRPSAIRLHVALDRASAACAARARCASGSCARARRSARGCAPCARSAREQAELVAALAAEVDVVQPEGDPLARLGELAHRPRDRAGRRAARRSGSRRATTSSSGGARERTAPRSRAGSFARRARRPGRAGQPRGVLADLSAPKKRRGDGQVGASCPRSSVERMRRPACEAVSSRSSA